MNEILPNVAPSRSSRFYLKSDIFKTAQNIAHIFGHLYKKIRHWGLSKIGQCGHTAACVTRVAVLASDENSQSVYG